MAVFALALVVGCGESALSNTNAGAAALVPAESDCELLGENETLIGVSPEGEAWFEGDAGVRVVSPNGTSTAVDADFTRADVLVAWDTQAAFVIGDNSLWNTTPVGAQPVSLPPELGKPRFVCGDPVADNGAFVITTRGLFEKNLGDWFRWSFPVELLETMEIRDMEGACSGKEPIMYMEAGDKLWEVRYGARAFFREAADFTGMTAGGPDPRTGFVAMRDGELLRFDGEGWASLPFDQGPVDMLHVADGVIWAVAGGVIYRRNRYDEWEQLDVSLFATPFREIRGYAAGGAWLVQDSVVCHLQTRETLRVDGVRPFGRLPEGSALAVGVAAHPSMDGSLSARVDGAGVQVSGDAGAWTVTYAAAVEPRLALPRPVRVVVRGCRRAHRDVPRRGSRGRPAPDAPDAASERSYRHLGGHPADV